MCKPKEKRSRRNGNSKRDRGKYMQVKSNTNKAEQSTMRFNERLKNFAKVLLAVAFGAVAVMMMYIAFLLAVGVSMAQIKGGW